MRKKLLPILLAFVLILLLLDPSRYFQSVKGGAMLFLSSVLPSMLPYFFFTKLLTATGCVSALSGTVGRPVARLYRISPVASYPLLMSFLSGYPIGARVIGDLCEKGLLSPEEGARASAFASTSGSMFVLGSVGAVILKDVAAGGVILAAHYLGALLNGFLYRGKKGTTAPSLALPHFSREQENLLSDAMYESVLSLALVGGFIAIANLLGDMATDILSRMGLGAVFAEGKLLSGLLYGAFEVTRGCVEFAALGAGRAMTAALCCLAVSFGGLSVILQSLAFLGKTGIKKGRFLLMKSTQAGISFGLCFAMGFLFL